MKNWNKHWSNFPLEVDENEFLKQVGKTVSGEAISNKQLKCIISSIKKNIQISNKDIVLDLCCGNGIITHEISKFAAQVIGIDYSFPLIRIANKYHSRANIHYLHDSILDINYENILNITGNTKITKIYMYEALQHFESEELKRILQAMLDISSYDVKILLGSIPNRDKLWLFYNTNTRKIDYFMRKLKNQEAIGKWWKQKTIQSICKCLGLNCIFLPQKPILHTAHYRFNAIISRH